MVALDLKKLNAPDFTATIRPGTPSLMVLDEHAVLKTYWESSEPRLRRQELAYELSKVPRSTVLRSLNPNLS